MKTMLLALAAMLSLSAGAAFAGGGPASVPSPNSLPNSLPNGFKEGTAASIDAQINNRYLAEHGYSYLATPGGTGNWQPVVTQGTNTRG
jgi:hypothetical protein